MPLTTDQLKAMNLGYLNGADLVEFCSPALLISRYQADNGSILRGAQMAYTEISRNLSNRYDITDELKTNIVPASLGTPVIDAGAIASIPVSQPGFGYAAPPSILISDPAGSGASATAVLSNTSLASVTINTDGEGYTSPIVTLVGGDPRENMLVQITAIIAVRKILANFEKISNELRAHFEWAECNMLDIRNGQMNLLLNEAAWVTRSPAFLKSARFKNLG